MKRSDFDQDREKKVRKVVKNTDKIAKHRNSIYNMLSEEDDESDLDDDYGEYSNDYHGSKNYTNKR